MCDDNMEDGEEKHIINSFSSSHLNGSDAMLE